MFEILPFYYSNVQCRELTICCFITKLLAWCIKLFPRRGFNEKLQSKRFNFEVMNSWIATVILQVLSFVPDILFLYLKKTRTILINDQVLKKFVFMRSYEKSFQSKLIYYIFLNKMHFKTGHTILAIYFRRANIYMFIGCNVDDDMLITSIHNLTSIIK